VKEEFVQAVRQRWDGSLNFGGVHLEKAIKAPQRIGGSPG
jgi:hypothetical protein